MPEVHSNGPTQDEAAEQGAARVDWIRSRMPLMKSVREEFEASRPFVARRIGVSLHIEPKTAVLLEVLQVGGAYIVGTGNLGSTQNDVAAYLRTLGMDIIGRRDDTLEAHLHNLEDVMDQKPDILLDNGADLAAEAIRRKATGTIIGATEETTSGAGRLRGELRDHVTFPCIVINDSPLKAIGENRHAVGQSVVESFMRITNLMIPGRRFVVVGYGWCGRGIAQCFRAFGGKVAIVETDEIKALEACFDGHRVGRLESFLDWGEVFVTATGQRHVISAEQAGRMASGAVLMNAGHFPWEIDVDGIRTAATGGRAMSTVIERLDLPGERHLVLVADGRMVNLAGDAPKGNSIASMDLGFTLQAFSLQRLLNVHPLIAGAQPVPDDINRRISRMMMDAMDSAL